ncbi:hypothetical protein [Flavobacterium silvaticum]|uniref:Thioredoxin-like fold domain-containing protein n=1 Tax=Flavobacterium silvaticum TaxID=1852020 RepID=A0A972JIP1_9FLAO|nr:hypothetical protein [Flavobacterium silvaticum]NMH28483.1 hypothetical protein [Flavobacterium silvaticum]
MRNYTVFKNNLVAAEQVEVHHGLVLGNPSSKKEIIFVTNPFCGHCEKAQKQMSNLLMIPDLDLRLVIQFSNDISNSDTEERDLCLQLVSIYLNAGPQKFLEAMNHWYELKDVKKWMEKYEGKLSENCESVLLQSYQWTLLANTFHTPTFFLNGYRYPKEFSRNHLEYFVMEFIDDESFS